MEDSTCESFEPLKNLDLPLVPTHVIKLESSGSIISESPNYATKLVSPSSPIPVSVTHTFPSFSQVYSSKKAIP